MKNPCWGVEPLTFGSVGHRCPSWVILGSFGLVGLVWLVWVSLVYQWWGVKRENGVLQAWIAVLTIGVKKGPSMSPKGHLWLARRQDLVAQWGHSQKDSCLAQLIRKESLA